MDSGKDWLGRWIARLVSAEGHAGSVAIPPSSEQVAAMVQPADVLLVEGSSRVSAAIKYLAQSPWSHAALCVEGGPDPRFVEADMVEGVRTVGLDHYSGHNMRIARPVGLLPDDVSAICRHACDRLGHQYDLRNIIDLARWLWPTPPVPLPWRRRMIALGSGDPTRAICSTLIAGAFQSIRYPILPHVEEVMVDDPDHGPCVREILHVRHSSLFVPADFDLSPYFALLKPGLDRAFDHHRLRWADAA